MMRRELVDIHTHVLPGIDDGAKDWEMCLEMLARSAECGVTKVIATPHYLPWRESANPEQIRRLCHQAEEELQRQYGYEMTVYPGNELYYGVELVEKVKAGEALTLADSRYVLLEFGGNPGMSTILRALREFQYEGYIPIIAHAERYSELRSVRKLKELKSQGVLLQMNIGAIQGNEWNRFGWWPRWCLRKGLIDFVASDMHNMRDRKPFTKERFAWIDKHLPDRYCKQLLRGNAENIINNDEIEERVL